MFTTFANQNVSQIPTPSHPTSQVDSVIMSRLRDIHLSYASYVDNQGSALSSQDILTKPYFSNKDRCEFDVIMYNKINGKFDPTQTSTIHEFSKRRQEEADSNNPDLQHCKPVRVLGIHELTDRFHTQQKDANGLNQFINSLNHHLSQSQNVTIKEMLRLETLQSEHRRLYAKILQILRKIEILRSFKCNMQTGEYEMKERLNQLLIKVQQYKEKLRHLTTVEIQRKSQIQEYSDSNIFANSSDMDMICETLERQREGLQVLAEIVKKDSRDMEIMKKELEIY